MFAKLTVWEVCLVKVCLLNKQYVNTVWLCNMYTMCVCRTCLLCLKVGGIFNERVDILLLGPKLIKWNMIKFRKSMFSVSIDPCSICRKVCLVYILNRVVYAEKYV